MKNRQKHHRIIATFFLLIIFPSILPTNMFASNNGPKSPEAASFEPVDSTDMVNLLTGQYSYVLPLLNVPSPEGGYPLALGYHAGISLDQEASWSGLGWNLNPGAIDRSVNGYPDDYNASHLNEFFYDEGGQQYASFVSVGYSCGASSVGLGFNWGSNQALGGFVSIGVGPSVGEAGLGVNMTAGTNGSSIGVGAYAGGLSIGVNIDSDGVADVRAGINSNGLGMGVGYRADGTFTNSLSLMGVIGFSLKTSKSKGATVSCNGVGMTSGFQNTVNMGDYSSSSTGWSISLIAPTPIGIFSLSFGRQDFKYWLDKCIVSQVSGPLYFNDSKYIVNWYDPATLIVPPRPGRQSSPYLIYGGQIFQTQNEANLYMASIQNSHPTYVATLTQSNNHFVNYKELFDDIYEVPLDVSSINSNTDVSNNNITFPSYDSYNVQAQGLSGSMKSTIYENGALYGLSDMENSKGYKLNYYNPELSSDVIPNNLIFDTKPNFYFDNEISSYLNVAPAQFNTTQTNSNIINYYSSGVDNNANPRNRTSNFVEYYTNYQIQNNSSFLKSQGYLQPVVSGLDRSNLPKDGIGAFKITATDGKTYHYSLPVYNHEIVTRTFGSVRDENGNPKSESQSYFEKRQLEPFATHWLLTAVTGPDYVDNGDGIAGDGDLGYWVSLDYGKWTDAFVWKSPYKKDYIVDSNKPDTKTWIRGRKQLYYLDKIKTRTHTALFVKSIRSDSNSESWTYNSIIEDTNANGESYFLGPYTSRFTIPAQSQLKLDRIILLKNEDDSSNKSFGPDFGKSVTVNYNSAYPNYSDVGSGHGSTSHWPNYVENKNETANYEIFDNVLDSNDNIQNCIQKAVKVVDFTYDQSLVSGDNRLTLKSVNFKGKSGLSVLPPYKFDYINDYTSFNIDKMDDGWGYLANKPEEYSLNKIITPQGGTINIEYESNKCIPLNTPKLEFSNKNPLKFKATTPAYTSPSDISNKTVTIDVGSLNNYPIQNGQIVHVNLDTDKVCFNNLFYLFSYHGYGHVTQILGQGKYIVTFDSNVVVSPDSGYQGCDMNNVALAIQFAGNDFFYHSITIDMDLSSTSVFETGGSRVSNINISDGFNKYYTDYKYGQNEDGVGYLSYIPYSQKVAKEVPYSTELPAPRVMYEYVTMSSHGVGVSPLFKMQYKFNVMKQKDLNNIKYGDFYEIIKSTNVHTNANKLVNIGTFIVKDNLASIGQLLEVKTYNAQGQMLSKVSNNYYKPSDIIPNNMGIKQESYQTYKTIDYLDQNVQDKWIVNSSTRIKYPNIIKSSTEQKNSYTYSTEFKDYDLISGVSNETWSVSSDGKSLKTKIVPAYLRYPAMGNKVDDINNRNMLSQIATQYSYILDGGVWKETGVGITTWSNVWSYKDIAGNTSSPTTYNEKIWRKHKSYTWNGVLDSNGIFTNYNSATDDNFDWTIGVGSQPLGTKWKQTSEITLYNHYSSPLEIKDINNNFASTKMGDNETKIMTTGNAGYNEMYFTGGENIKSISGVDWLEPGVKSSNGTRSSAFAHTGTYSIAATSSTDFGIDMKSNEHKAGRYKLSVWVLKVNANSLRFRLGVSGTATAFNGETVTAGNWVLKTHYFNATTAAINPVVNSVDGSTVYLDDLIVRPIASSIAGYVYNEWDELTYIIGNNGLATKFEYDNAGRLTKTYTEVVDDTSNGIVGGLKLKIENKIKYKNL